MNKYKISICFSNSNDNYPAHVNYEVFVSDVERQNSYLSETQIACMRGIERLIYNYNLVPGSKIEVLSAVLIEETENVQIKNP